MVKRSIAKVAIEFSVSETSVNKWNKAFKWQRRIAAWDVAIREGVEERAIEAVVNVRIQELEQLDRAYGEIEKLKPLIFSALEACLAIDPKTGKKRLEVIPQTTQDMTALYNAMARLNTTQVKIVEVSRKIRGEPDKVEVTGSLKHDLTADPEIMAAKNTLLKVMAKKEHV
jgi:hypothetical protein